MTSRLISRASATVLLIAGLIFLFAPDAILPRLVPGYPADALWLGQLLGAGWLGMAALNWFNRATMIGGIYGRPVVMANVALYFIGALVILKAAQRASFPPALLALAAPAVVLAITYGWLLLRGPLAKDFNARSAG